MVSRHNYPDWLLSAVYASSNVTQREVLWRHLESTVQNNQGSWLLAGDFNDFSHQNEKQAFSDQNSSNAAQSQRRSRQFVERINKCSLMDLGCVGPRLTWSNNRKGWANTMVRLDRALCNSEWHTLFPDGCVRNLPWTYSDHSPLMVYTQGMHPLNSSAKPFRFEVAWISHEEFRAVVADSWVFLNPSISLSLETLAQKASAWNKHVFGNIFRNKRWLIGRVEGIQKSQARYYSHNLHLLEMELVSQYNHTLYQEELLWFQKSHSKWITQGDRNTKYFHLTIIAKRRKLKIDVLKSDSGD
ncbi:uncharacterized protein LOC114319940 [Camellia sinensis]|uniref:uncharacterized protein LOC114319940 n=1 Tax=Camellia sinensis TaxID=4442 RepID=UPI001036059B|nr:uncharacterized protein LOC114319940 [Camellia sinensis]